MTTEQKMYRLLIEECFPLQQEFFKKMYPNMPSSKQIKHALTQVERTVVKNKEHNTQKEKIEQLTEDLQQKTSTIHELNTKNLNLLTENQDLKIEIAEYNLVDSKNNDQKDIQKRLLFLEALEQGGVDNWGGYEFALDTYRNNLINS